MSLPFDAAPTEARVETFWQLAASFGRERNAYHNYLNEIVSDRYTLIKGLQILRDELQFGIAIACPSRKSPIRCDCLVSKGGCSGYDRASVQISKRRSPGEALC